jgi:hypothetical protein
MTIKIDIPENIVTRLREGCGYNKEETENIFKTYLTEIMSDMYGQFEESFDVWLEGQEDEELNQIKNGKQL